MTNCEICPIKEKCDDTKEKILNGCVADMRGYAYNVMDYCPLVEIMMDKFEDSVRNLTKN